MRWARVHGERLAGLGKKGRRRIEVEVEAVLVVLIARVEFMKFEKDRRRNFNQSFNLLLGFFFFFLLSIHDVTWKKFQR